MTPTMRARRTILRPARLAHPFCTSNHFGAPIGPGLIVRESRLI